MQLPMPLLYLQVVKKKDFLAKYANQADILQHNASDLS